MATGEALRKITISVPEELVQFADHQAAELNTSRSRVIAMALSAVKAGQADHLAAEGYQFYAQEAREFATASHEAVAEAWSDSSDTENRHDSPAR